MRKAEQIAWGALAGLVTVAVILLTGAFLFRMTAFWAGTMLVSGEAFVVGIAAWGLMLGRQAAEMGDSGSEGMGFRMGGADDVAGGPRGKMTVTEGAGEGKETEAAVLDTGFQRLVVGSAGGVLVILAVLTGWLVYGAYAWARANPDKTMPIVGNYADAPDAIKGAAAGLNNLGVLIGLASVAIYVVFYVLTRGKTRRGDEGMEALKGNFTLGILGMGALAVGTVLAFFQVSFASELAAAVMAVVMGLQGLELLFNSMRSYSGIEELDEEAVDLQSAPLVPMMGSVWLGGLKMLFAQSVGMSSRESRERGVIARMMPRVLLAVAVIAIAVSCLRVVQPGEVAVLERLGYVPTGADGRIKILGPGLHVGLPWPMDSLRYIPTEQLQETDVGTELHAPKEWKNVDFEFWTLREAPQTQGEQDDLFLTGDRSGSADGPKSSPQILETYVQVLWKVKDPALFYGALSHSDFFQKQGDETTALPIYKAIVQQCTSYAVTQNFAIHTLDQIMVDDRQEVENHCRKILQDKLDDLKCGIEVEYLTIKDLHPPLWKQPQYAPADPSVPRIGGNITFVNDKTVIEDDAQHRAKWARGPASAFEFVTSMREFKQQLIDMATAQYVKEVNEASGFAAQQKGEAMQYQLRKIAQANGDVKRLQEMTKGLDDLDPQERAFELSLKEQQFLYSALQGLLEPVNKVLVDPAVKDVQIWQTNGNGPVRAPGQ